MKWYEKANHQRETVVASRVRLVRNVKGHLFPNRLSEKERRTLREELQGVLSPLFPEDGYTYLQTEILSERERRALRERRLINSTLAGHEDPMGLFVSDDDEKSILLCGDDHLRLQNTLPGTALLPAWEELSRLDDAIGEVLPYAFDEKYGYLTAFPTNVGTGLRATEVLHLPALSQDKSFRRLTSEMNRFGIMVRPVYGEGADAMGALYEISNQKTLGLSEAEIIGTVQRMAGQMATQENKLRKALREKGGASREDQAYKAYGVLRYARILTCKEAMTYLSCVRAAVADGYLTLREPVNMYGLMLKVQEDALPQMGGKTPEEMRAILVRTALPDLE